MLDGCELDLELCLWSFRMALKDFQDEIYPIPDLYVHFSLFYLLDNSIELAWLKYITNNNSICLERIDEMKNFVQFAFSDISTIVRLISFLKSLQDDNSLIGRDKLLKLEDAVIETVSFEESTIFWSYIEEYGAHGIIIGMNCKTPIFAL